MEASAEERRVARLPAVATEELVARYERSARLLRSMIASAVRRGALGTARERRKALAAVNRVLEDLRRQTEGLATLGIQGGYEMGAEAADASARANVPGSEDLLTPEFAGGANRQQMQALQASAEAKLSEALGTVGRSAEDLFRRVALEEVGTGIAAGLERRETSKRIADRLAQEGIGAFVDKAGRVWKLDTYARMVARTTQREAASLGTIDRLAQVGLDLVKVSDHHTETELCEQFEGKVFSISGKTEGYPRLKVVPPFHPNCQHVLGAAPENLKLLSGIEAPSADGELAEGEPAGEADRGVQASHVVRNREPDDRFREELDSGIRAIEKVHRFPEGLDVTPDIQTAQMPRGNYGAHNAAFGRASDGTAQAIAAEVLINRRALRGVVLGGVDAGRPGEAKVNPTVHELGHFLDSVHLGDHSAPQGVWVSPRKVAGRYGSRYGGEATQAWRDAVEASHAGRLMLDRGGSYAGSWEEIWARSYEQWIALRADDAGLRAKHEQWVEAERAEGSAFESYWTDPEDFAPIAAALDDLFATRGLLKR